MCGRAGRFHGKHICGHAGHARARRGLGCAPARRTRQLWAIAEGAGGKSCWHGQHELMQQYERHRWRAHDWSTECASGRPLLWPNRWVGRRTAAVARCQSKEARPRRSESPSRPTSGTSLPVHSITSSICVGTHRIPNNSIFTLVQRWNSPDMEPCDQS